jgi:hypothetical protein
MVEFCSLYSEALRLNRALEIKDKFKEYGLVPDQYCYNSLIKVLVLSQEHFVVFHFDLYFVSILLIISE